MEVNVDCGGCGIPVNELFVWKLFEWFKLLSLKQQRKYGIRNVRCRNGRRFELQFSFFVSLMTDSQALSEKTT
jgi:hypothetical protein